MNTLFPGFRRELIKTAGADINAVVGPKRDAPALLLLHGYPQTHAIWHRIAPGLAERFNVVASDLRELASPGIVPETLRKYLLTEIHRRLHQPA